MMVPAGTVERLAAYLDVHPNVAVAGPLIRGFDGRQQGSAWRLMTVPVQLLWALTLGRRGAVVSRAAEPRSVGAVAAGAAMYRRQALEEVGLFDEAYFMFGEEGDLAQRWRQRHLERHYVPDVELFHAGQQSTAHLPERQINEVWRSLDLYLSRYHSPAAARVLRWLTGLGYGLALIVARIVLRLPARLRPAEAETWNPGIYRLHVRNAFRGTRSPGMSDLAEEWNRLHGVAEERGSG
jgi:GT2 family glycosyltransferase